jgi:hypothetical protein
MPGMRDVLNRPNPLEPKASSAPSLLSRIGVLFGFGLLNAKIMWYALGTLMFGLGAGVSIDSWLRTGQILSDWFAWSGLGLAIVGNVIGNLAHTFLKKDARRKLAADRSSEPR